jgi:hypothetical protein
MTDTHIRILRLLAEHQRRELDDHDAADHTAQTASAGHRRHLKRAATRTRGRVAEAEARRLYKRPGSIS